MREEHTIHTPFDVLLSALKESSKPLSAYHLSRLCGMREHEVVKWAHVLEKSGQVRIVNSFNGIYISWAAPVEKKLQPIPSATANVSVSPPGEPAAMPPQKGEEEMRAKIEEAVSLKLKHSNVPLEQSSTIDVGDPRIERVDKLIDELKQRKEESIIESARREAADSEETVATETEAKTAFGSEPLEESEIALTDGEKESAPDEKENAPEKTHELRVHAHTEKETEHGKTHELRVHAHVPSKSLIRPKYGLAIAKPRKIGKIKKPEPVQVTGVSLQFSERLSRQMKKIESQARAIDGVRLEKEKLLSDHYIPLQHRLESELETISDRVLRVQNRVIDMQKHAADLPGRIIAVEKVQISSIKAHNEMRRAYDEACVLLEETSTQLADEREKMEIILDQSREELSRHSAMTSELHSTMDHIEELEGEAASRVSQARASLAEQAERLASAESHANDLRELRGEIGESIFQMKREVASAKRVLSDLERQMSQMRQIDEYTSAIRKDYDSKMSDIDEYIRNGNREFETLRESVEANFVRRYLRELRALTEGYSFEFNQAKRMESDIDARAAEERMKLEALFEEGKKISYLFETQARAPENAGKFESHADTFSSLSELSSNRSQVAQMIAQVLGNRTERLPNARIEASEAKVEEIKPFAITELKRVSPSPKPSKAKVRAKAKARAPSAKKKGKIALQGKAKMAGKPALKGKAEKAGKNRKKGKAGARP